MNKPILRRPASLREVAAESQTYREFGYNLKDFFHKFALARERQRPLAPMVSAEPTHLAKRFAQGAICDAFVAATADYLARSNRFRTPAWALRRARVLAKPWFSEEFPEVRLLLLRDTPSAFKDKNLFVFASALKVA